MLAVVIAGAEKRFRELLGPSVGPELRGAGIGGSHPVLVAVVPRIEEIEVVARTDRAAGMRAFIIIEGVRL